MTKETKERAYVLGLVVALMFIFNILVAFGMPLEFVIVCAVNVLVGWNLDKICSYLRIKLFGGRI